MRGKRLRVLHVYPERTSLRSMPPTLKRGCAILLRSRIATVGPEAFCFDVSFAPEHPARCFRLGSEASEAQVVELGPAPKPIGATGHQNTHIRGLYSIFSLLAANPNSTDTSGWLVWQIAKKQLRASSVPCSVREADAWTLFCDTRGVWRLR